MASKNSHIPASPPLKGTGFAQREKGWGVWDLLGVLEKEMPRGALPLQLKCSQEGSLKCVCFQQLLCLLLQALWGQEGRPAPRPHSQCGDGDGRKAGCISVAVNSCTHQQENRVSVTPDPSSGHNQPSPCSPQSSRGGGGEGFPAALSIAAWISPSSGPEVHRAPWGQHSILPLPFP